MKNIITILLLPIILCFCGQSESQSKVIAEKEAKAIYNVEVFHYDTLTIPLFFKTLIRNHLKDFYLLDSLEFLEFCFANKINANDSSNIEKFYTIKILHELFTSQSASNCSKGEILNIPYQWHWIQPNPRHEIYFVSSNRLLKDTKPANEFSKYNSHADIDRTPYLFLSDLVHSEPKYYSISCDTFSTFGWCSEREMAFVALAKLLDYDGKVVAENNHSWSEFIIPMKINTTQIQNFKVTIDNTFNSIYWTTIVSEEISKWRVHIGNASLAKWYNGKAKSNVELRNIRNHLVSNKTMSRIENELVMYLDKKINKR